MTKHSNPKGPALVTEMPGKAKSRRARNTANLAEIKAGAAPLKLVKDEPATPASRFTAVKDGRKWFVDDAQLGRLEAVGSFKTKAAAEAEAAVCQADFDGAKASGTPTAPAGLGESIKAAAAAPGKTEVKPEAAELTGAAIAAMSRTERLVLAKAEMEALRAYRTDGRPVEPGSGPATPVLDWMTDPNSKPATRTAGVKLPARTEQEDKMVVELISAGRACSPPVSWAKIAEQIEAQGIPTNRGGKWYDTTVSDLAKKLNLFTAVPA